MNEIEEKLKEIEADLNYKGDKIYHLYTRGYMQTLAAIDDMWWLISEVRAALKREAELQERHAALLTQNMQQEEEIAGLERRHEEEKKRADMLHDLLRLSQEEVERLKGELVVGEAGGRLLQAVQEKTEAQYNELLFAVCRKFPDESRHETALRYIREAELKIEWGSGGIYES